MDLRNRDNFALCVLVNTLQYHDTVDFVKDSETKDPQLPIPLCQLFLKLTWTDGNDRNVQGVLGVHVDDLVGGGNCFFRKLCNGFGLNLILEYGNKVDFDFVVENCVKISIVNPSRSPCHSKLKKWSPLLFPNR